MAIKFSQFNLRTDHTSGMYLVGYDGNQNIHITVDNLFDDFINGTENTIAMFGTDGTVLADSILSQDAGATLLTVVGQLNVDAAATFDTSITVTGDSALNGNVTLGDASTDLITQTGTLYLNGPVKDTTDTLGAVDQVLLSDATGELTFTDLADLHVGGAEVVEVPVKNVQGSALVKGDPVYISGSVGASGRLEVQLADASNTLKMPAVGLLKQDLADQAEGFAVVTGKLRNLITDPIDGVTPVENDVIYVKPSGTSGAALTTTKPVYGNFIQNIGKVGRVSTSNDGNFVVSSILRTNDIPNLTPGRLWIGSTGNTIESQTLFVDEANGRLGINEASPGYSLDVDGTLQTSGWAYFATSGPTSIAQLGGASTTTSQFNITSAATGGSFIAATNTLTLKANNLNAIEIDNTGELQFNQYGTGTFTGTATKNLSVDGFGNVIETNPAVDGSGTLNYVPKWTPDGDTLGDSVIYDDGTNVGIGTNLPGAKLDVEGNAVIGAAGNIVNGDFAVAINKNTVVTSEDGFAQGENTIATGRQAAAFGFNTYANGPASIAGGSLSETNAQRSIAVGATAITNAEDSAAFNTGTRANGLFSFATGQGCFATNNAAFATGSNTQATGLYSFSGGVNSIASGNGAVALGGGAQCSGEFSFAAGNINVASGLNTTALGFDNDAIGNHSAVIGHLNTTAAGGVYGVAINFQNTVSGQGSFAFNQGNTVSGLNAAAGGVSNTVTAEGSFAYGYGNDTSGSGATPPQQILLGRFLKPPRDAAGNAGEAQVIVGRYNEHANQSATAFAVGVGTGVGSESNAITALYTGSVGIGTTSPASKLDVNGGIRMADDSSTASASNVGTLRYRTSGNNSYVDMCMQTDVSTYAWVNIVQNNW
jgi:hypothetical protein